VIITSLLLSPCLHQQQQKNATIANLLSLPIFASSIKKKKMNNGNKLVVISLFVVTTIEGKKCDNNKLATIIFFASNIKKEKLSDNSKLVVVTLFAIKNKRKKKVTTCLCRCLLCFK
jgi:hypothetical protein